MNLGQKTHIVPVLAPVEVSTGTTNTDVVGLKEYEEIEFLISFGAITGDEVVVSLVESTNTTASGTDVAGKYRLSSAVGTDTMGAVTTLASTGVTLTADDDNKMLLITVDPATLTDGYPYVFVEIDPGSSMSSMLISGVALLKPRYPQAVQISAVD